MHMLDMLTLDIYHLHLHAITWHLSVSLNNWCVITWHATT